MQQVTTYQAFEQKMKALGYKVLKGRGISFIDDKKVKIKGSEVGFSLSKIERILELRQKVEMVPKEEKMRAKMIQEYQPRPGLTASQKLIEQTYMSAQFEQLQQSAFFKLQDELFKILFEPQQGEQQSQSLDPHWLMELKRKRRKNNSTGYRTFILKLIIYGKQQNEREPAGNAGNGDKRTGRGTG